MKITAAEVRDPRREGVNANPLLILSVDENVRSTREPILLPPYRVQPHGPFMAVDQRNGLDTGEAEWEQADIGAFNASGLWQTRLVDVLVFSPEEEIDLAMGIDRARRIVRKFVPLWQLTLDDVAAQHGGIKWRLTEINPTCTVCNARATGEVFYSQTHLTLCPTHLAAHNRKVKHLRVTTNS